MKMRVMMMTLKKKSMTEHLFQVKKSLRMLVMFKMKEVNLKMKQVGISKIRLMMKMKKKRKSSK